jgi:hypothetical protein
MAQISTHPHLRTPRFSVGRIAAAVVSVAFCAVVALVLSMFAVDSSAPSPEAAEVRVSIPAGHVAVPDWPLDATADAGEWTPLNLATAGHVAWSAPELTSVPDDALALVHVHRAGKDAAPFGVFFLDRSGRQLASVGTEWSPMVVFRGASQELLVSDIPVTPADPIAGYAAVVRAFDLSNQLNLKWEVTLPGRIGYTLYSTGLIVTTNDRWLVYQTMRRDGSEECAQSGDGPACALYGLGVLDLSSRMLRKEVPLPRSCGPANLQRSGDDSILVSCSAAAFLFHVSESSLTDIPIGPSTPRQSRSDRRPTEVSPVVGAYSRSDGSIGILFESGEFRVVKSGQDAAVLDLLPPDAYVVTQRRTTEGSILISYQTVPQKAPAGALLLDIETMKVQWRVSSDQAVFGSTGPTGAHILAGESAFVVDSSLGPSPLFRLQRAAIDWVVIR